MKSILFLALITVSHFTWSQSIYASVSAGYQHINHGSQPPSYIVNTFHQLYSTEFCRLENLSFSDAVRANLSFGHLLTENMGYEITGSYFNPLAVTEKDGNLERQFSGQFFIGSLKVILSVPINKFDVYAKLGVNYAMGELSYRQSSWSFEEHRMTYEYTDGSKLGFNLALGTSFKFNNRLSIFTEICAMHQLFEPKKGQLTEKVAYGEDEMTYFNNYGYYSQIQFGDEFEWQYSNTDNLTRPQKLYKRNYSLGGIGINLGIKFTLWSKKKGESGTP